MKALRIILIIVLVIVAIAIILGLVGNKTYDVNATATIDAPVEMVFPYVVSLKKGDEWGPWREGDPGLAIRYEGEDGEVGSKSIWDGPKSGKGEQTVVAIEKNKSVDTEMMFYPPWGEASAEGYFRLSPKGENATEITWGFKGENDFIGRMFDAVMNMEKSSRPMFEDGLRNLNELVQSDMNRKWNNMKVGLMTTEDKIYLTSRSKVPMTEVAAFLGSAYGRMMYAMGQANVQMSGAPSALYYNWDEESMISDMAAAAPLAQAREFDGFEIVNMPARRAIQVDYYGSYSNIGSAHITADSFAANFDLAMGTPVIEEYVTDPGLEQDTSKWLTRIYYPLED